MQVDPFHVEADTIDYHAAHHEARRRRALKSLDVGDVLSVIDDRIASEPDPAQHLLYHLVVWHLDKCLTPMDGAAFFDQARRLVIDAINVCLDEALSQGGTSHGPTQDPTPPTRGAQRPHQPA